MHHSSCDAWRHQVTCLPCHQLVTVCHIVKHSTNSGGHIPQVQLVILPCACALHTQGVNTSVEKLHSRHRTLYLLYLAQVCKIVRLRLLQSMHMVPHVVKLAWRMSRTFLCAQGHPMFWPCATASLANMPCARRAGVDLTQGYM